jgi:hypothetical protein
MQFNDKSAWLNIKAEYVNFLLSAMQAFKAGVKGYSIGNRRLDYMDPKNVLELADQTMLEIRAMGGSIAIAEYSPTGDPLKVSVTYTGRAARRSRGIVPRDW